MSVTPSGCVSMPLYLLRRMVSVSSTFQTAVGVATSTLALDHIYLHEALSPSARPCAVINELGTSFQLIAGGGQNQLRPRGDLFLWLARDTPANYYDDPDNALLDYMNFAGGVIDDIVNISGADQTADSSVPESQLAITAVSLEDASETPREVWKGPGRFWWSAWRITWGDS